MALISTSYHVNQDWINVFKKTETNKNKKTQHQNAVEQMQQVDKKPRADFWEKVPCAYTLFSLCPSVWMFFALFFNRRVIVCGGTPLLQSFLRRMRHSHFPSASKMDQRDTVSVHIYMSKTNIRSTLFGFLLLRLKMHH